MWEGTASIQIRMNFVTPTMKLKKSHGYFSPFTQKLLIGWMQTMCSLLWRSYLLYYGKYGAAARTRQKGCVHDSLQSRLCCHDILPIASLNKLLKPLCFFVYVPLHTHKRYNNCKHQHVIRYYVSANASLLQVPWRKVLWNLWTTWCSFVTPLWPGVAQFMRSFERKRLLLYHQLVLRVPCQCLQVSFY